MMLDPEQQISRKLLKILQDHGGCWPETEIEQIDSGEIRLAPYLHELISHGYIYHDQTQRKYVLTDSGGRRLATLDQTDRSTL